jgi:hypothetical protein
VVEVLGVIDLAAADSVAAAALAGLAGSAAVAADLGAGAEN